MDSEPLMNGNLEKGKEEIKPLQHPCTQEEFNTVYHYVNEQPPGVWQRLVSKKICQPSRLLVTLCPALEWLPTYNWKKDFLSDVISGFTVAIMHIPQGMAYSSLGGVPPIVGIYMAFFPVLVYFFFGSSRHVSMGTFAVVCMMAGEPVRLLSGPHADTATATWSLNPNATQSGALSPASFSYYTPVQVATVVCLVVGLWQVVLGVCRLGSLSVLMSEPLVSGFTTGAAVLVFTSQVKHMFGIKIKKHNGPFAIIYMYTGLLSRIEEINIVAFLLTVAVVFILVLYTEVIKPRITCKSNFPLPMELIMVILGTLVSNSFELNSRFNVSVVGEIPTGLPDPQLPPLELIPKVLSDGLVIAIVAFSINISMASIFARKENYKVDANQELIASGLGNVAGSFFSCLPFAASLSRSLIQHTVGGKTQLASVVSCAILCLVLLFIGPFFEPLPHCVLAGIILIALKGMLRQVLDLPSFWRQSWRDGAVWLLTFGTVVLVGIDVGLCVGVGASLLAIVHMSQTPFVHALGNLPDTDIYLEVDRYHTAMPIPSIAIVRICGGMHFANRNRVIENIKKMLKNEVEEQNKLEIHSLLIDLSSVIFIDPASSRGLLNLEHDLKAEGISLYLARCSVEVYEQLKTCDFFTKFSESCLFPSVQDAILFINQGTSPIGEANSTVTL